jgi:hypothetical protein
MMGMVFTELLEMVEATYSLDVVDVILEQANASGVYTAVGYYDDAELVALLQALATQTGRGIGELLFDFGKHVFSRFLSGYPSFFLHAADAPGFLEGLESVVHKEVRKLYANAHPPLFVWQTLDADRFALEYRSQRALGEFAHGLLRACLAHYGDAHAIIAKEDCSGGLGTIVRFTIART